CYWLMMVRRVHLLQGHFHSSQKNLWSNSLRTTVVEYLEGLCLAPFLGKVCSVMELNTGKGFISLTPTQMGLSL
ncbi:hypothetical protein L2E82_42003, partial [Cichorium intybus]